MNEVAHEVSRVVVHHDGKMSYTDATSIRLGVKAAIMGLYGSAGLRPLVAGARQILLKPNLVLDRVSDPDAALTNGSIIQAVCDLVMESMDPGARIIIADVPLQSANITRVLALNGLGSVLKGYQENGAPVEFRDLRMEYMPVVDGIQKPIIRLDGDPEGYEIVNLGSLSELDELSAHRNRFAVGDYDQDTTRKSHMSSQRNEYLIPRTVLTSDVVINLPKLKTHKKSGITVCLKNLVGICGHKSYLPHFREGGPASGGDEFAVDSSIKPVQRNVIKRLQKTTPWIYRIARWCGRRIVAAATRSEDPTMVKVMAGSWYGNDTLWRTILDLNRVALYADRGGAIQETRQRRFLNLVDAVVCGEGEGPITPSPVEMNMLLAGESSVLVDLVGCLIMEIPPNPIKQVSRAFGNDRLSLVPSGLEQSLASVDEWLIVQGTDDLPTRHFALANGWEYVRQASPTAP